MLSRPQIYYRAVYNTEMDYFNKTLYIPQVDRKDNVIGQVERWKAHEDVILHRGFTIIIGFQDKIIIQHRRHPVFDDVYDITCSSHPIYVKNKLQPMIDAIYLTLKREWNLSKNDLLHEPKFLAKNYYKSKNSQYSEHEVCYVYKTEVKSLPLPDLKYAYGSSLLTREQILNKKTSIYKQFAPWVYKMFSLI